MQKIAIQKIVHYGRGHSIPLPKVFVEDNLLDFGKLINVYRHTIKGKDVLILEPINGTELPIQENNNEAAA